MATQRQQTTNFSSDVLDRLTELAGADPRPSAESMRRTLQKEFPVKTSDELRRGEEAEVIPSARWIRDFVRDMNFRDGGGPWSLATAEPDWIPYVLPVLQAVASVTQGRVRQFTNAEADLIGRIRRGASDLPLIDAYWLATHYLIRQARDAATDDIDQFLSWAPWRDAAANERYVHAVEDGWISGNLHYKDGRLAMGWPGRVLTITIGAGRVVTTKVEQTRGEQPPEKRAPKQRRKGANS